MIENLASNECDEFRYLFGSERDNATDTCSHWLTGGIDHFSQHFELVCTPMDDPNKN